MSKKIKQREMCINTARMPSSWIHECSLLLYLGYCARFSSKIQETGQENSEHCQPPPQRGCYIKSAVLCDFVDVCVHV